MGEADDVGSGTVETWVVREGRWLVSIPAEGPTVRDSGEGGEMWLETGPAHSHLQIQARTLDHALGAVGSH